MGIRGISRLAVAMLLAASAIGATAMSPAGATPPTIAVSPSTGLAANQSVTISVSGAPLSTEGRLYIVECGNAYANGTPLPATVNTTNDCSTLGWILSPFAPLDVFVKQTGIGNGNRSCMIGLSRPCFIYGPTGINLPDLPTPSVDISFAVDPTGSAALPTATSTTLTPVGSPVATGKPLHALVHTSGGNFAPDGPVTITEGLTTVGTGTLANGYADVVLSPLSLGSHSIVAHYAGDGSFLGSDSTSADMDITNVQNISIGDVSIVNGVGSTRLMYFPVVLSKAPPGDLFVTYTIESGTALPGVDYSSTKTTGTVKFTTKSTIKYVVVKLLNDASFGAGSKTFTVKLSGQTISSYAFRDDVATGTILHPATANTLSVGDVSMPEGDIGAAHTAKFSLTLSSIRGASVTVTVTVSPGTAKSGKRGIDDYGGKYSKVITIAAGVVNKLVAVPVWVDTKSELDETYSVLLSNIVSSPTAPVTIARDTGNGVIIGDE